MRQRLDLLKNEEIAQKCSVLKVDKSQHFSCVVERAILRYPGSRFNRHPALQILLGQPIQFWLQCSRTHRYTCYAIYPQVRCNSIWHSRKRLAKVSIFTPVFRLFPLIPVFHPCSKSSYSTGFSRTYAHFNSYYKSKENLFSQIRSIGKSPLSRFSLAPAATSKGGGMLFTAIALWRSICPLFSILFASLRKQSRLL